MLMDLIKYHYGDVSEWFMVTHLKCVDVMSIRGFESYHLRQYISKVCLEAKHLRG